MATGFYVELNGANSPCVYSSHPQHAQLLKLVCIILMLFLALHAKRTPTAI